MEEAMHRLISAPLSSVIRRAAVWPQARKPLSKKSTQLKLRMTLLICSLVCASLCSFQPAKAQIIEKSSFLTSANIRLPTGLAFDQSDDLYVYNELDPESIVEFSPNLSYLGGVRAPTSPLPLPASGALTRDPQTGSIIALKSDGLLFTVDRQLAEKVLVDLKSRNWDVTAIFDVNANRLNPALASPIYSFNHEATSGSFGAIYALMVNNTTHLWVSGETLGYPFLMAVPLDVRTGAVGSPKVILASSANSAGECIIEPTTCNNQPRGVAFTSAGVGLTPMPITNRLGVIKDHAVIFSRGFRAGGPGSPSVLFPQQDITSVSIATDPTGNFFVSTGVVGSSLCGVQGSGGIIVIPHTLTSARCYPVGRRFLPNAEDIATNARGTHGFLAITGQITPPATLGGVISFSIVP
jgi:hypothetical protein